MSKTDSSSTSVMQRAINLAKKGEGFVLPNPMVGALILKDNRIVGEGYHEKYGEDHAEINAIKSAGGKVKGATLFVTLEPCCHNGKTPPCTKTIIESGIKKVFIACKDPSEKVCGKGMDELKKNGLEVELGILEEESRNLNEAFFTFHQRKRPFISLKVALSLDGKIAETRRNKTKLTSEVADKFTHKLRRNHQAILVGSGTVISDDPHLGIRGIEGNDPLRIILKGRRRIPKNSQIFRDDNFIILEERNVNEAVKELYERGLLSILVEGGEEVFTSFLNAKLIDKAYLIFTPVLLGETALSFSKYDSLLPFSNLSVQQLGCDILITTTPKWDLSNG